MRFGLLGLVCALISPAQVIKLDITGSSAVHLAAPDLNGAGLAQTWMAVFNETVFADLQGSSIFEMKSKSLYPKVRPAQPADLRAADWAGPPVSANYVSLGYAVVQQEQFVFRGWLMDLQANQPVLGATYLGPASAEGARKTAHEFAADIIRRFGGEPLFGTKIFFRSKRTGNSEIWVMDADGGNQRQLTNLKSLIATLGVSPDGRLFAATTGWPQAPAVAVFASDPVRRLAFQNPAATGVFAPSFTPDGKGVVYSACKGGNCRVYAADLDGRNPRQISSGTGIDTEPKFNPKTGAQIAFVSDRSGRQQIYTINTDGGDTHRLTSGEGYASNPAWRPNGQHLAFSWTLGYAPGGWNIFVMDSASRRYVQLTHGEGRNENPSWAPDGAHLVFASTRPGSSQIWTMRADGTDLRQLTRKGANDTPVWSR
jgi:TolB protein